MATTPNLELLYDTLEFVEENPDLHDQTAWAYRNECGTFACFAGWACVLAGQELRFQPPYHELRGPDSHEEEAFFLRNNRIINVYARKALGLTDHQAYVLFDGNNDLDAIRRVITAITFDEDVDAAQQGTS